MRVNSDMLESARLLLLLVCLGSILAAAQAEEALTWQECVGEAAKNHPDLISAEESLKQSQASKRITASVLYPQINAGLNASTSATTVTDPGVKASQTQDSYSYGVSGSQLLFDGFKTGNEINAATENTLAAQQNYRFVSSEVRLRLRTAFVNLLKAQQAARVVEDIAKIRRDNLELIMLRYTSGLEHRGALLTAEANLAQANYQIAQAKRDVELAQRQMMKEMGRTAFTPISVQGDFSVLDSAKEKPDLGVLAKGHPSLRQAVALKNAAGFGIKSAYANFSPTLSGQADANKSGPHWMPKNSQLSMGLSVSVPLFEGGLRLAQVAGAKALYGQLEANERSTLDGIVVGLEQAWVSLQDAVETVVVQKQQLDAAEERSKIAEAQFSTGFITYDNWTIIQDNLVSAKRSYLDSEANALFAEANWIQAKGETLEYAHQ
jgi:outer membrane protein TolC